MNKDQQPPPGLMQRFRALEVMDRIAQISLASENMEDVLRGVLDLVLEVFNADRAWFLYPCDPAAPSWGVPMERTRPEWPGLNAMGVQIPMSREVAELFAELLKAEGTLQYGPHAPHPVPQSVAGQFSVKSQLQIALHPKTGSPWAFGLHHCADEVMHNAEDIHLFTAIALRIADTLSSLISTRKLHESESRLNFLVASSPVTIYTCAPTPPFGATYISPNVVQILGYQPQQFTEHSGFWAENIHPEDRQRVLDKLPQLFEHGIHQHEYRFRTSDGSYRWMHDELRLIRDESGKTSEIVGYWADITERKQAEDVLRFHSKILKNLSEGIYLVRVDDGTIVFANPQFEHMFGYASGELLGKHVSIVNAPDDKSPEEMAAAIMDELARTGGWSGDVHNLRKDGTAFWCHASVSTFNHPQFGEVWISVHEDITERKQAENVLREKTQLLDSIVENIPNMVFLKRADDLCFELFNRAGETLLGHRREDLLGRNDYDFFPREQADFFTAKDRAVLAQDEVVNIPEEPIQTPRGTRILHTRKLALKDARGRPRYLLGISEDITERKQSEEELRIAATAFESQEGMMVTDAHNIILRVNRAFTAITGYTAEEAIGQTPRLLKSGRQDAAFYASMWGSIQRSGAWQGEIWNRRKNGEPYPEYLTVTAVKDRDNGEITHYVATMSDITARKQAEQLIYDLAFHDALTRLPNRRLLNDRMAQAIASSKRSRLYGSLMFLDLDNFKPLNDAYGHEVGDLLLVEAAHRIGSCVREMDTVARFGGDEFVVMLAELDMDKAKSAAQAGLVAEKIRSALSQPYVLRVKQAGKAESLIEHHCTSSIGVMLFVGHEARPEDLLKWADMAMYQAKNEGGNRVCFHA